MYRFAIDGNEANVIQRVGSNVYAFEVLTYLEKLTSKSDEYNVTVLLSSPPVVDMPIERAGWTYKVVKPRPMWTQIGLPTHLFLHKKEYDVFFTPGHYAPRTSAVPYISSVMDLAFLQYPKQFRHKDYMQLKEWTRYSVKHAAKVLAISEFTKQAIIKTYKKKKEDVFVAYPSLPESAAHEKEPITWLKKELGVSGPYVLYVGTLQPRKNLVTLVKAFELFSEKYPKKKEKPLLVIAGKIGWLAEETLKTIENSPVKEQIKVIGYVTEGQKQLLYRKSLCAVLIGLYEGFGIPPLEAMANGTLPVVANTSSLPEVVGEAGFTVDPTSVKDIADTFGEISTLGARQRASLLKKGRVQVKAFSWQKSAEHILEALREVADRHGKKK